VNDIIKKVKGDYENNGVDIEDAVNKFVSELRQEGLAFLINQTPPQVFNGPLKKEKPA